MSVRATQWARDVRTGDGPAKSILWALADAADDTGRCFLSHQTIADRTDLHRRCVGLKLQLLELRGLIRRERRTDARGHRTSDNLILTFATETSQSAPDALRTSPDQGAPDAHRSDAQSAQGARGDVGPKRMTGHPKAHDTSCLSAPRAQEAITEATSEAEGDVEPKSKPLPPKATVSEFANRIWKLAPKDSRHRSSLSDLTLALEAALKRNHDLDAVMAGVAGYFATEAARKENGKFAKGVHRVVQRDRWKDHLPNPIEAASPAQPVGDKWKSRLESLRASRFWNSTDWGPRPGKPGCLVPADLLAAAPEFPPVSEVVA
jgi:hypothetical protein